jgi:hypothetical protein
MFSFSLYFYSKELKLGESKFIKIVELRNGRVAQVVECMASNCEALHSKLSIAKILQNIEIGFFHSSICYVFCLNNYLVIMLNIVVEILLKTYSVGAGNIDQY